MFCGISGGTQSLYHPQKSPPFQGNKKARNRSDCKAFSRVEVAGFEPAAFWSRTKRATKLRYTSESISSPPRRIHRDGPYTSQ